MKTLAAAPQIVIGSLSGAVAGGGMSLALGLDLLLAADDATSIAPFLAEYANQTEERSAAS